MRLNTLPPWARELLERERIARLAFHDDEGGPRVLPITFALFEDAVWSAIDDKPKRSSEPARVRRLRRDPRAALLVDVYGDYWEQLRWVQVMGRVDVLAAGEHPAALGALAEKYEQYARLAPPGPLLRLAVERSVCWRADEG